MIRAPSAMDSVASVGSMENVTDVLSLVSEIDRKALTYRVMPKQIDSKILAARRLTDPDAAASASAGLLRGNGPRRSSTSSSRGSPRSCPAPST